MYAESNIAFVSLLFKEKHVGNLKVRSPTCLLITDQPKDTVDQV